MFQKVPLQAQGYKIIDSNILQSMLNEVGRCTSCGAKKEQIRKNVNKRIGMCENLVVEKEKKNGMINLRSVAVVTSLGGGLTSLRNLCMHFDFPPPLAEHSYQSYLKYL